MPYDSGSNFWIGSTRPKPIDPREFEPSALCDDAETSGREERGMLWHGTPGTGKTTAMLAAFLRIANPNGPAISQRTRAPWLDRRALWTQAIEYCRDVTAQIDHARRFSDYHAENYAASELATRVPCLFVDDLGTERATDHSAETIGVLIDARYRAGLATWFTTNLTPVELSDRYGDRTMSRLAHLCRFVAVCGTDRRIAKAAIS